MSHANNPAPVRDALFASLPFVDDPYYRMVGTARLDFECYTFNDSDVAPASPVN
jgi:hypothetical protein